MSVPVWQVKSSTGQKPGSAIGYLKILQNTMHPVAVEDQAPGRGRPGGRPR